MDSQRVCARRVQSFTSRRVRARISEVEAEMLQDPSPPPFRGDVWDVVFPRIGTHPAIAMTTNALRRPTSNSDRPQD